MYSDPQYVNAQKEKEHIKAAIRGVLGKKVFLEISQNSQENTFFAEHLWTTASKHNWNESQEKLIPIYITGNKCVSRQQQQNCFHKNDIRIFKSFLTLAGFPIDFRKCWNCLFCCLNLGITFFCFFFLFLLRKIMNYEFFWRENVKQVAFSVKHNRITTINIKKSGFFFFLRP